MNKPPDKQRRVLGKGLSALLPQRPVLPQNQEPAPAPSGETTSKVAIDLIDPNPVQPRTIFEPSKLHELASSIQANGVIQPLILRRKGDRYELVAGERRLRASKLAQLLEVPAVIQDYADETLLQIALVENIQREDLNPIETAQALERLATEMNLSHEEIGRRTGKDRATVTNLLRLLRLPKEVQILVAEHRISMGHARAILGLTTPELQTQMAERSAAQGFSVRQVERLVKEGSQQREATIPQPPRTEAKQDPNVTAAVRDLENTLGTRVRIVDKDGTRGMIQIEYYSQDDLNRIYELLMGTSTASVN